LIVMSAVEWPFGAGAGFGSVSALQERLEEDARKALRRLLPPPDPERPAAQAFVVPGKAGNAIVTLARARAVDLIVMGVSGRRGALDIALLGSTTHHMIRQGAWPVLTVPSGTR
jgi:nucleotide-binding universal stress UspA family protein